MQTCSVKATFAPKAAVRANAQTRVVCMAVPDMKKAAAGFAVGVASLALTSSAFAATIKLGADNGR